MTPIDDACERCGQVHLTRYETPACTGHVDEEDGSVRPCGNAPRKGGTVCGSHGGRAPQVLAANARRLEAAAAEGEFGRLLAERGPELAGMAKEDAMQQVLDEAAAMCAVLGELVGRLPVEATWGWKKITGPQGARARWVRIKQAGALGPDHQGNLTAHPWLELYGQWTDRRARYLKLASDMGLEARRQQLAEEQLHVLAAVLMGAAARLGLQLADPLVAGAVRAELELVEGTAR